MTEKPLDRVEFDEQATTLLDIAITKGHAYANARAPNSRVIYGDMKDAYKEGFLQGFAHRMGGGHGDTL